jgi:geranylgeranyl pyrophosphate synthase
MTEPSPEQKDAELPEKVQKLFEEKGRKALEIAKRTMSREQKRIECKEVKEALDYFMNEYWLDIARPALLSIVCEAVGGNPKSTTSVAVSSILISGAADIYDDIIDRSKTKYGKRTVYGRFGKDIALLIGNALLFKGIVFLSEAEDLSEQKRKIVLETMKTMFFELGDAEAMELHFRSCATPSPEEYLKVIERKAADVEAHTRIAAVLGGADGKETERLGRYGRLLGMLIILRDDILDLLDDYELKSRIAKEHLPLPILCSCQDAETKSKLDRLFKKPRITSKEVRLIRELTEKTGGIVTSVKFMKQLASEALSILEQLKISREHLVALIRFTLTF